MSKISISCGQAKVSLACWVCCALYYCILRLSTCEVNLLASQVESVVIEQQEDTLTTDKVLSFLDKATQHHQLTLLHFSYEESEDILSSREEIRQVYEKFSGKVGYFSMSIEMDSECLVDFCTHCDLTYFKTIKLNAEKDTDFDEFPQHLMDRLACFKGELTLESDGEVASPAAHYYWANRFLQQCSYIAQLNIDSHSFNAVWRELLRHPKVRLTACHFVDPGDNPDEVRAMTEYLESAQLMKLSVCFHFHA